jgi:3-oxoacyl-[acyl-carrier-protein] synthase-1
VNPESDDALAGGAVFGHSVACGLGDGFVGRAKALVLARAALEDLCSAWSAHDPRRVGVYMVVSDYFLLDSTQSVPEELDDKPAPPSEQWRTATADFVDHVVAGGALVGVTHHRMFYGGHSEIVTALLAVDHDLSAGIIDVALVGAVDSYIEPRSIRAAARGRALKTENTSTGFFPGEAAAFVAVTRTEDVHRQSAGVVLRAFALAEDVKHLFSDEAPDGAGLAEAVVRCVTQLSEEERQRIGLVIGDLNGEEHRALEWGACLVRLQSRFALGDLPSWQPAASFGETGCASGVLSMCVGIRALQRGYAGTDSILLLFSSDGTGKAALCLSMN